MSIPPAVGYSNSVNRLIKVKENKTNAERTETEGNGRFKKVK